MVGCILLSEKYGISRCKIIWTSTFFCLSFKVNKRANCKLPLSNFYIDEIRQIINPFVDLARWHVWVEAMVSMIALCQKAKKCQARVSCTNLIRLREMLLHILNESMCSVLCFLLKIVGSRTWDKISACLSERLPVRIYYGRFR